MSTEVAIIKRENVELIASTAPQAYSENQVSRQRCLAAGNTLLATIQQQGMNDELDQQAASFIEKARKTVKKMYDKRSPLTKLFDDHLKLHHLRQLLQHPPVETSLFA